MVELGRDSQAPGPSDMDLINLTPRTGPDGWGSHSTEQSLFTKSLGGHRYYDLT